MADLLKERKEVASLFGLVVFTFCNVLYDYTNLGSNIWFLGNFVAMASYLYASTIDSEAKLFSRLALWVCMGALIEEMFFIVGMGDVLIPNLMDYLSFELFFIYEYLKYKGWVK